ncbi:cobalamin biosynthesis protein CbiN [Nitrosopumilus sp.]|uniref:cobalamin biosynthesis protein CbiN n=1 Tax=Nitrosopumilus sp. TaxID=2024843 RepID=UPI003B5C6D1D
MKARLLTLLAIGITGFAGTEFACLCDDLTIEKRVNQADVVFSGTIKDSPWNFSEEFIAAGFDVKTVWKGADSFPLIEDGYVTVVTAKVSTACGVNFIAGKEYLVYAKIDNNGLYATTCAGSWFLDGRADDVEMLDAMGATHHFIDARQVKGSSSDDCRGPGPFTVKECEFEKLVRNVLLPVGIALPLVGLSVFFIWRKRR